MATMRDCNTVKNIRIHQEMLLHVRRAVLHVKYVFIRDLECGISRQIDIYSCALIQPLKERLYYVP